MANKLSEDLSNNITLIDNLHRGRVDNLFKTLIERENVHFINLDLRNLEELKDNIWSDYEQVYHLAAIVGVKHCVKYPELVLEVNLKSSLNIVQLMKEKKCKKILLSSTSETYADGMELGIIKIPTDEKVPLVIKDVLNPRSSYAVSKIASEQIVIFNSKNNYNYSIVRYHNIFGPRMGYAHVIPEVIKRILKKENPFKVYGYNQSRAFCYVDDAINQTIAVMDSELANSEIFHIGNNTEEIKILDLVKELFRILNYKAEMKCIEPPKGSVDRRSPDTTKINKIMRELYLKSSRDTLKETAKWYQNDFINDGAWE